MKFYIETHWSTIEEVVSMIVEDGSTTSRINIFDVLRYYKDDRFYDELKYLHSSKKEFILINGDDEYNHFSFREVRSAWTEF